MATNESSTEDSYIYPTSDLALDYSPYTNSTSTSSSYAYTSQDINSARTDLRPVGESNVCQGCRHRMEWCNCGEQSGPQDSDDTVMGQWQERGFEGAAGSDMYSQTVKGSPWEADLAVRGSGGQLVEEWSRVDTPCDSRFRILPEFESMTMIEIPPYAATFEGGMGQSLPNGLPYNDTNSHTGPQPGEPQEQLQAQVYAIDPNTTYPTLCQVPHCRTKTYIRDNQGHHAHMKNVHGKRSYCQVPGCPRKKPFTNESDRKRHDNAKHTLSPKLWRCDRDDCEARARAFRRKDKFLEHNRKYHSSFPCQMCVGFFHNQQELIEHSNAEHGNGYASSQFQGGRG